MSTAAVGQQLRRWRERRHLSQLARAARADVSTRHVSFVENGRSRPTPAMILRLAEQLDVPLRDRNAQLVAGGFAPAYPERPLTASSMAVVSDAVMAILEAHQPFPALVVDRQWDLVSANAAVYALLSGVAAPLLEPPVNVIRLTLHPTGSRRGSSTCPSGARTSSTGWGASMRRPPTRASRRCARRSPRTRPRAQAAPTTAAASWCRCGCRSGTTCSRCSA